MLRSKTISNSDDIIDIRDVIERFEELEDDCQDYKPAEQEDDSNEPDDWAEFVSLRDLIEECKGNGGDHQWRGDWYPVGLIRDSYFKNYAQEFAEDIGAINKDASWPNDCIDWDEAAKELQQDYTSIEFDGVTYWTR